MRVISSFTNFELKVQDLLSIRHPRLAFSETLLAAMGLAADFWLPKAADFAHQQH
jgi:hypothetical protein